MRSSSAFKAVLLALLLAPANAYAGAIFQDRASGSDFALFPFWQQVLKDMSAAAPPPPAPIPAMVQNPIPGNVPAIIDAARPAAGGAAIPAVAGTPLPATATSSCANERVCVPPAWTQFLDSLRGKSRAEQLDAVNRWANAKPYVEDIVNWGVADYWETPGEFLAHGGDCEDYAIAKYFSLVRLGFSPDDLRLVVVNDTAKNEFHAVLAVRDGNNVWLLDNQLANVTAMDSAVQYAPVYSLNEHGWWMHSLPRISLGDITIVASGSP